jgi:serine/threonine protein phosphatase PrpC
LFVCIIFYVFYLDSRGVLSRASKAIPVSIDHKPNRPDEKTRIESVGGRVGITESDAFSNNSNSCLWLRSCFLPGRPQRVFPGGLSVSRTIGDISIKRTKSIIATPEMWNGLLTDDDQFLILACDGVWDVLGNQHAVNKEINI